MRNNEKDRVNGNRAIGAACKKSVILHAYVCTVCRIARAAFTRRGNHLPPSAVVGNP